MDLLYQKHQHSGDSTRNTEYSSRDSESFENCQGRQLHSGRIKGIAEARTVDSRPADCHRNSKRTGDKNRSTLVNIASASAAFRHNTTGNRKLHPSIKRTGIRKLRRGSAGFQPSV